MARRVFFSFHFERDIFRANQVRNSNVVAGYEKAGFFDESEYENLKYAGRAAIERRLRELLDRSSVTVVLVGQETHTREWVDFEIEESKKRNNGFLAVYIHHLWCIKSRSCDQLSPYPPLPRGLPADTSILIWRNDAHALIGHHIEQAAQRAEAQQKNDDFPLLKTALGIGAGAVGLGILGRYLDEQARAKALADALRNRQPDPPFDWADWLSKNQK
jgi:hypothetical protein